MPASRTDPRKCALVAPASAETFERVMLGVGTAVIVEKPTLLWTVLGSCVSVILHVPRFRMSAICHAQIPEPPAYESECFGACPTPCDGWSDPMDLRYVTCCIQYMLKGLSRRGISRGELLTTLVGGANVLPVIHASRAAGDRNVAVAKRVLRRERLAISWEDTGGLMGRTIEHNSVTNKTTVRYHQASPCDENE